MIIILIYVALFSIKVYKASNNNMILKIYVFVVFLTLLAAFFEPNVIYGKFQDSVFFWFAAGRLYYHYKINSIEYAYRNTAKNFTKIQTSDF